MKILLPQAVVFILDTLSRNNYKAYIVGGCVRDSLLGKQPNDWDITTNALPDQIMNLFLKTMPTGIKHGTVTVVVDGDNYEVTTFRIESAYSDNRHPDQVFFTSNIEEDLSRRDFTINAMAYNPSESLVDAFNSEADLKNKIIRCVGNADERFKEDALRMLRAIRFSTQLNFELNKDTLNSIIHNSSLIENVSLERIRDEISKILICTKPSIGIRLLQQTGLLEYILPELEICVGFNQHNPHHHLEVFDHIMEVLDLTPPDLVIRLAALFHDIAKPKCLTMDENGSGHFYMHEIESAKETEKILKRLRFDNNTISKVCILIREHMQGHNKLKTPSIKKLISRVGTENLNSLFELNIADIKAHKPPHNLDIIYELKEKTSKIINEKQPLAVKDLKINGIDLINADIPKGKSIGAILNTLLDKVIENPELNEKDILLKQALEIYNNCKKD
jgi:tRNA nucleotidyltransferase (CCA-adding enzyme)